MLRDLIWRPSCPSAYRNKAVPNASFNNNIPSEALQFARVDRVEDKRSGLCMNTINKGRTVSGGGGYFRNFWVGMSRWDPGTLNLHQSQFSWILLPYTRVNTPTPPYPGVAVFQKLLRSLAQSSQSKPDTTIPSLDKIFNQLISFLKNDPLF